MLVRSFRQLAVTLGALVVSACATVNEAPIVERSIDPLATPVSSSVIGQGSTATPASGDHRVVRGDTLYGIAFRHGLDFRDLARWNGIQAPFTIYPGQRLRLGPPPVAAAQSTPIPSVPRPVAPSAIGTAASRDEASTVVLGGPTATPPPEPGTAITFGLVDTASADSAGTAGSTDAEPHRPDSIDPQTPANLPVGDLASGVRPPPDDPIPESLPAGETPQGVGVAAQEPGPQPAGALAQVVRDASATRAAPSPPVDTAAVGEQVVPPVAEPKVAPQADDNVPTRQAGGLRWRWPVDGTVVVCFAAGDPARQGIDVRGRAGAPVVAAADGEVVYSGNGLLGYGELIIIQHSAEYLSAYGHNRRRLVAEGQRVRAGQVVAEMGRAPIGFDALHFEIRRAGRPIDPLQFLPSR